MRGYFGVGIEQSSKPMNAGNLFRTAHAFGASFLFTVNADYSVKKAKCNMIRLVLQELCILPVLCMSLKISGRFQMR